MFSLRISVNYKKITFYCDFAVHGMITRREFSRHPAWLFQSMRIMFYFVNKWIGILVSVLV